MKIKLLILTILSFILCGCEHLIWGTVGRVAESGASKPPIVSIVNYTDSKIAINMSGEKKLLAASTPTQPSQIRFEAVEEFKLMSVAKNVFLMRYDYEIESSYLKITISYADPQKKKFKIQLDYLSSNNKTKTKISLVENKESRTLKKLDRK